MTFYRVERELPDELVGPSSMHLVLIISDILRKTPFCLLGLASSPFPLVSWLYEGGVTVSLSASPRGCMVS
jgi:hypothetical protein